jgi:ribosomal protein S18 acetylase RimI-like enzyme
LESRDRDWAAATLRERWGSGVVVTPAGARDATSLAGFVAEVGGERVGLVTYAPSGEACEVVTLDSLEPGLGVGTALLDHVRDAATRAGCRRLWLITTNDNTSALRFYQRRGWNLVALHRDVIADWRRLKPEMPAQGLDGIPLRHALELELWL